MSGVSGCSDFGLGSPWGRAAGLVRNFGPLLATTIRTEAFSVLPNHITNTTTPIYNPTTLGVVQPVPTTAQHLFSQFSVADAN